MLEGVCYLLLGDKFEGREAMERARVFLEQQVARIQTMPVTMRSWVDFRRSRAQEDAIREGKRAVELLPESKMLSMDPACLAAPRPNLRVDGRKR